MSPGQQANDTHLTVWWHPNPLRYLTRGTTNLLAIIQFASCKLPFHSMKKWFPICNICVKRITNVILIFLQTIRYHKGNIASIKLPVDWVGEWYREKEEEEEEEDGEIVTTSCWLRPMLQKEQGCLKKIMKRASTSHTVRWNQSVRDSKNVHHLFSARSLSRCQKKKKKNNFEYISRHNFSANQK